MERFTTGLRDELLTPLEQLGVSPGEAEILALEATARGLRVLATEGRAVGSGPAYDQLLDRAAEVLKGPSMRDKLALTDRLRLVEILSGPDVALTMLDRPP